MCRMYRSVHRDVPRVLVCIGMGAHACDRHIPNVPTQTYLHIRDKIAVVAVNLATFPDSLVTLLVEIHKYAFGDINSLHKVKQYLLINKKYHCQGLSAFWPASISSARGRLAPPMNVESDIVREKMHGKQTGTRPGTRPLAYNDVTWIYQHIPPGHANKCSHSVTPLSNQHQSKALHFSEMDTSELHTVQGYAMNTCWFHNAITFTSIL